MHNLGISYEEKLKLYIGPKMRMGIKNEMQLFVSYNHGKEKVMKEVLGLMERID